MDSDSLVGQRLGPFTINGELGRGGMGVVYRAYQPNLAREVALKVLPRWFAAQPGFVDRFRAEARAAARLHHPNIVTVHDVGALAVAGQVTRSTPYRIFVQAPSGSFTAVSPPDSEGYAPAWSRDGQRIAFQSGGGALNGILTMDPTGANLRQVVAPGSGFWARAPVWSPDGKWIAYVSGNSTNDLGDVFMAPASGGQPRQITTGADTYDWRLAWLP